MLPDFIKELAGEGFYDVVLQIIFTCCFVSGVVALVLFLFKAFGIFNMAKSAKLEKPWLAFIPVINYYIFGRLAEKYCKRDGTKSMKFGVTLLILKIVLFITASIMIFFTFFKVFDLLEYIYDSAKAGTDLEIHEFAELVPTFLLSSLISMLGIALTVIEYIALWRIYSIFNYSNATLYLVLSVFFSFLPPIFLFVLRKREPTFEYSQRMGFFTENY